LLCSARARKLILKMSFVALATARRQVCAQSLPTGWTDGDIGSVGPRWSATYANGVFTVKGAGPLLEAMPTDSTLSICRSRVTEQSLRA